VPCSAPRERRGKQHYHWLAAVSQLTWQSLAKEAEPEDPNRLKNITAQAGTFTNAQKKAANDLVAKRLIFTLIWVYYCAIYRANLLTICAFSSKTAPNKKGPIKAPYTSQPIATKAFSETPGFFWMPLTLRRINSPLTQPPHILGGLSA
jgi:hypothetical protein